MLNCVRALTGRHCFKCWRSLTGCKIVVLLQEFCIPNPVRRFKPENRRTCCMYSTAAARAPCEHAIRPLAMFVPSTRQLDPYIVRCRRQTTALVDSPTLSGLRRHFLRHRRPQPKCRRQIIFSGSIPLNTFLIKFITSYTAFYGSRKLRKK